MLVLEETSRAKRLDISPEPAAFVASSSTHSSDISQPGQTQFFNSCGSGRSGGRGRHGGHTGSRRHCTSHKQIWHSLSPHFSSPTRSFSHSSHLTCGLFSLLHLGPLGVLGPTLHQLGLLHRALIQQAPRLAHIPFLEKLAS